MYAVVERGTAEPPSRQIAASLRAKIASGEYAPDTLLPSIITLAETYQVTTNTVRKALGILRAEGLIDSLPGYGTFVVSKD